MNAWRLRPTARLAALLLAVSAISVAGGKWELQYQHIDAEYDLRLLDMAFVDASRGIASGVLTSRKSGRIRPVNLVTTDGKSWKTLETKKICQDVFALAEGIVFAACEDGIYRSNELGRDWERTAKLKNIEQIWFTSARRGFAVGVEKSFFETSDGGEKWAPVKTTPEISTSKEYTTLRGIYFADGKNAMVTGWSRRPTSANLFPDWMTPERAVRQRDTPHVNLLIDSRDGGATWSAQDVSMFGEIVAARMSSDGAGLGLINFSNAFEFPSEVFFFRWPSGVTERVHRDKGLAITDVALPQVGPSYLVGIEPAGQLYWSPLPGRLKVLESTDFRTWTAMDVDYRASATRAKFCLLDAANVWAMTDNGTILKLNREFSALPKRVLPERASPAKPSAAEKP